MMPALGQFQEECVNIIAIMGPHGVYHKDEPIKELEAALQQQGFQTIWPQNSADLLQFIEHNPRICGVIFDWMSITSSCAAILISSTNICRCTRLSTRIRRWMSAVRICV
ncbi:Lysine decarboxylase, constitutive [Raoultella terrigena]|uniref:Lysine decarboxylase, constitutive n=1 Tax=Raoultella terrigena TaxID=577 RepID=A0A4V6J2I9_RAOTE|nr:Lysine decarboxylase, constitutive [Raoultella terrigena]